MFNQKETFIYLKNNYQYEFYLLNKDELFNLNQIENKEKLDLKNKIQTNKFIQLQNAITNHFYIFIDWKQKSYFVCDFFDYHKRFLEEEWELNLIKQEKRNQIYNKFKKELFATYLNNLEVKDYLQILNFYTNNVKEFEITKNNFENSWMNNLKLMNFDEANNYLKEIIYLSDNNENKFN